MKGRIEVDNTDLRKADENKVVVGLKGAVIDKDSIPKESMIGVLENVDTEKLSILLLDSLVNSLYALYNDSAVVGDKLAEILSGYEYIYEQYDKYKIFCDKKAQIRDLLQEFINLPDNYYLEEEKFIDMSGKLLKLLKDMI